MSLTLLRENLGLWRELLGLCWRRSKALYCVVIGALVLDTCAIALIGVSLRLILSGTVHDSTSEIVLGALGAGLAYTVNLCVGEIGMSLRIALVELVGFERVVPEMRAAAMGVETVDHLERSDYLDQLSVVQDGAWGIVDSAWAAVESIGFALRLALTLALLGSVSPLLFLVLAAAAIPLWCEQRGKLLLKTAELARGEQRRLQRELFELATDAASGKEIRVAGAGDELVRLQRAATDAADRIWVRARIRAGLWSAAGWCAFALAFVSGLALVVRGAAQNPSRIGDIVLAVTVGSQLRMIVEQAVRRSAETGGSGRLLRPFRWLRAHAAAESAKAGAGDPPPDRLRRGITFDEVCFSYPGTDGLAVQSLSAHLSAGSVVAVVGEYGSGKTTLIKLLTKMYRPDSGRILVDGADLADLDTRAWRAGLSAAFQDFGRYHASLAEAVGIGDVAVLADRSIAEGPNASDASTAPIAAEPNAPQASANRIAAEPNASDASAAPISAGSNTPYASNARIAEGPNASHASDARIARAIADADAQELVARLPHGAATELGRQFGGTELSEGQWQKLALARASMRPEPLLFVLDEPTASLDAPSEHAIFERYMERARLIAQRSGGITLIVSHRFSTVAGADQILVLERGRLIEAGSHAELLADSGSRYAELYGLQANAYGSDDLDASAPLTAATESGC
jgi:ATP-binding cassette subfamily B protein